MKFLNWGKIKAALNIFQRRSNTTPILQPNNTPVAGDVKKITSFTLPDRTVRVKPKRFWERRSNAKVRLPADTKIGTFSLFPFGKNRHVTRSGTVLDIRGQRAKIRMTCKTGVQDKGWRVAYRKISTPQ